MVFIPTFGPALLAQASAEHVLPKILTLGPSCSPVAGPGRVVVQVLVHADGSFAVQRVISSTNPGDDAAALEVAATSTYQPGTLNGKADDEFFDGAFNFNEARPGENFPPDVCAAATLVAVGKYDDAKAKLGPYLQSHPDDPKANLILGVADELGKDSTDAVAAFDRAGAIDPRYVNVAASAYIDQAQADLGAGHPSDAYALAAKAVALAPNDPTPYAMRGLAEEKQNITAAVADLERAHALAIDTKASSSNLAAIDSDLADAYVRDGFAMASAGKPADAVARLEAGAVEVPAKATSLYGNAALILANAKSPNWSKVKTEADKALASDPSDGLANYVAGAALLNESQLRAAAPFLNKAKISALYKDDSRFAQQVDAALKALGPGNM